MALLHALLARGYRRLVVCHLNHLLRGTDSDADAEMVARRADELKLPCVIGRMDVRALASARHLSLETAAREARKTFFFETAQAQGCRTLFLAHHADDQVETVLFNLFRGTGGTGLAGMRSSVVWETQSPPAVLRVVRPLLGVWRREVDAYVAEHNVTFREDATNEDPSHTRNRVRREIIPMLNEVFRREVSGGVWRAADILGAEETWMRALLQTRENHAAESVRLPIKGLLTETVAVQRRLLRSWLRARGVRRVGYQELESTRALLDPTAGKPAKVNLPGGLCVRRRAGVLFIEAA